jgi:gliding motility-associated-like protein
MKTKYINLFIIGLCFQFSAIASHIIGGELTYISLGDNEYEVTLTMYRDCDPTSATFELEYTLSIFNDDSNSPSEFVTMFNPTFTLIEYDALENDCLELPDGICVEQAIFTQTITITSPEDNFTLYVSACCRDENVINLFDPSGQGSTFTTSIPSNLIAQDNNSATFVNYPPLGICLGDNIEVDLSASDIDGDSLVYELTSPYNDLATNPPFSTVNWSVGYSANYPVDASPNISINSQTGIITGSPNQMGMYIIAVKVSEYNNGVLINELIRDFRFLVVDCELTTASFPQTDWYCSGLTVEFTNESLDADDYLWTFGDPLNPNYSTTDIAPSYTFPAEGTYTVTLIANPGDICADTMITELPIFYDITPDFTTEPITCSNDLNFIPTGNYPPGTNFVWDFGPGATPQTSSNEYPLSIAFNSPGLHNVSFNISINTCDTLEVNDIESFEPVIDPLISVLDSQCFVNNSFDFEALGSYPQNVTFDWDFGSNTTTPISQNQNPSNINFTSGGDHQITLIVNYNDCPYPTTENVYVHPNIDLNFTADNIEDCEPLQVEFTPNIISNTYEYNWNFDGTNYNQPNPSHTFSAGNYDINVDITDTNSGCVYNHFIPNYIISKPQADARFDILSLSPQCFENNSFNFNALTTFNPMCTPLWNFGINAQAQFSSNQMPSDINFEIGGIQYIQLEILLDGCNSIVYDSVYVHPEEFPEIYSTNPIHCEPLSIDFSTNSSTINYSFYWDLSTAVSNAAEPSATYMAGDYDVNLELQNLETGCPISIFLEDYVHVEAQPISNFTVGSFTFLYDDEVWIENLAQHSTNYLYDFGTGYTSTDEEPIYTYPSLWDYLVTQYAMNDIGCIDSSTIDVFIDYPFTFYLPTAFSPNGDNINDEFYAEFYKVDSYDMTIFDRWGQVVFSGSGKQPTWKGENAQQGTYNYLINYNTIEEGLKRISGFITLIR